MQPMDDSSIWHQQQQEEQQWLERDYDISFGSFARDFKRFVMNEEVKNERT